MVNRESLPLILGILIPFMIALISLLYFYGYDVTLFLRKIPLIYYVIIFPIALGFSVAIIKYMRPD
jgi:hypothetical protein